MGVVLKAKDWGVSAMCSGKEEPKRLLMIIDVLCLLGWGFRTFIFWLDKFIYFPESALSEL